MGWLSSVKSGPRGISAASGNAAYGWTSLRSSVASDASCILMAIE